MKKDVLLVRLAICLVAILTITCNEPEKACKKCQRVFTEEKRVKTINHYDASSALKDAYQFYYKDFLIDSIVNTSRVSSYAKTASDYDVVSTLKVFYPTWQCIPSYYVQHTIVPDIPVSVEKAFMSVSGPYIHNKHLAYYPDENFLVADHTAEIDYMYNGSGQVTQRNGTDYSILIYPNLYSNENTYTYTGSNITKVVAQKEQSGYYLTKTFDAKKNPFNIQGGVMFYLSLIAYNDDEYFETIAKDKNNVTKMVYKGTDTSNSFVTITYTFNYSYLASGYPSKVNIYEVKEDEVYGNSETDHGTFVFEYY
jgi:hypothetical protein